MSGRIQIAFFLLRNHNYRSVSIPFTAGWTKTTADKYCGDFLRGSPAADKCRAVPDVSLGRLIHACRTDLLYSGNARVAGLHLDRLKQSCRASLFRNTSLWTAEDSSAEYANGRFAPPRAVADALCLNDCAGNGVCDRGICRCNKDYIGADCSQTLGGGPVAVSASGEAVTAAAEPAAPTVSALSNFGLCDTRTKPCREIIVLGEGLVNHAALKCNVEVYKVRVAFCDVCFPFWVRTTIVLSIWEALGGND